MRLKITAVEALSATLKRITLTAVAGDLPVSMAGAHILLSIPGPDRVWKNAYSLVSKPGIGDYQIIVRRVENSRGGSAWLHDHAGIGEVLEAGWPANLFPIVRTARRHLLVSAGIGVTPFLAYLPVLRDMGAAFELHHVCKVAEADVFAGLLPVAANVTVHTSRNALNLAGLLARQKLDTHLYLCGPADFMEGATAAAQACGWPGQKIHLESFGGATGGAAFTVRLARAGVVLDVREDESLLEAMEAAGFSPPYLCRGGACGQCELPVLDGVPEHFDHVLSAADHAGGGTIMTCVSRAKTAALVLDF